MFRRAWRIEDRAVDGLVKRLRRKLNADAIASVRGVGYALRLAEASATVGSIVEICVPEHGAASPVIQFPVVE
ncbi:winged helix-turn-helix domain-containing protein [Leptolyngbya sp. 15MV]|nr:winged helix-turn-helix domain-containing protein [Leptolyngbya sp. 15MV]